MTARIALAALLLPLAACTTATYDEAFGRPDATRWTYFEASPATAAAAIENYFSYTSWQMEGTSEAEGGVVLTFAPRAGGSDILQILVQASPVEGFGSRAQVYPRRRPLPRAVEQYVSTRG